MQFDASERAVSFASLFCELEAIGMEIALKANERH